MFSLFFDSVTKILYGQQNNVGEYTRKNISYLDEYNKLSLSLLIGHDFIIMANYGRDVEFNLARV